MSAEAPQSPDHVMKETSPPDAANLNFLKPKMAIDIYHRLRDCQKWYYGIHLRVVPLYLRRGDLKRHHSLSGLDEWWWLLERVHPMACQAECNVIRYLQSRLKLSKEMSQSWLLPFSRRRVYNRMFPDAAVSHSVTVSLYHSSPSIIRHLTHLNVTSICPTPQTTYLKPFTIAREDETHFLLSQNCFTNCSSSSS